MLNSNENIILYDSPEAAKPHTMHGWLSRNGHFYQDEALARSMGATHKHCDTEGCNNLAYRTNNHCDPCGHKHDQEEYDKKPKVEWDKITPIFSDKYDRFFFTPGGSGLCEIQEFVIDQLQEEGIKINAENIKAFTPKLRLYLCEPEYAPELDIDDHCQDDLPEDGEVPNEIREAAEEFNGKIVEYGKPLGWFPSNIAVKI